MNEIYPALFSGSWFIKNHQVVYSSIGIRPSKYIFPILVSSCKAANLLSH